MSEVPTASSIYSQPSPEINNASPKPDHPPRSSSLYPDDISPPDSPRTNNIDMTRNGRGSPDVSPISDNSNHIPSRSPVFAGAKFSSNLPVPKKTRKFWNRPSVGSPEQGSNLTHWDAYSGEPTTSEKGKPPSTTPNAVKLNTEPFPGRQNDGFGTSTHISGGTTIGRKRVASRDSSHAIIIRPEWKGAGGRHKIVNPMFDKPLPQGQTPTFPVGSEKSREQRQNEQDERERAAEARAFACSPTPKPLTLRRTKQTIQPSVVLDNKEIVQHTDSPNIIKEEALTRFTPPTIVKNTRHHSPGLLVDDMRSPLARNPSNEEMRVRETPDYVKPKEQRPQMIPEVSESSTKTDNRSAFAQEAEERRSTRPSPMTNDLSDEQDPSDIESRLRADLQQMNIQDEPRSRFSATTYATTVHDSPPETPILGADSPAMPTPPSSILNRKRPIAPAGLPNPRPDAQLPTPSETRTPTQAPEMKRKALPKSPPEKEAVSRVAGLQAKLDNLRRRRGNLQTVIYELTHVVQPSSIAYDMASRAEIKRTVEGLNKELADVIKDEHETGLKLHRAMKREDEFAAYEPTSIWVRRVTT